MSVIKGLIASRSADSVQQLRRHVDRPSLVFALALTLGACTTVDHVAAIRAMDDATMRREISTRFQYPPPRPVPGRVDDQRAGRIADATYFAAFPDYDRSYSPHARAKAKRLALRLQADAGSLTRDQFTLRIAEIAALADNGHTTLLTFGQKVPRIPVRFYLFADGLHVLDADAEHAALLGARIDRIDGCRIDDIYRVIRRYRGGSEALRRNSLVPMLEAPGLLQAAGVTEAKDSLVVAGVLAGGAPFERRLTAETSMPSILWPTMGRLLFPGQLKGVATVLQGRDDLPLSLQQHDRAYWSHTLAPSGFYVRMLQNVGNPIAAFVEETLTQIRKEHSTFVVLDMRMNPGGDYTTTYAFARSLPKAAGDAPIYILTSPWTFSAAITTISALKEEGRTRVKIVGENVGDRLDFWAEGRPFLLPNSGHVIQFTAGRHVYNGPCNDIDQCFWLNYRYPVHVPTLRPDIAAPWTFAAYRDARDPALEAVLAREAIRTGSKAGGQ